MRSDPETRIPPERHPTQVAERGPAARVREPCRFVLDPVLVERVRREVGEPDVVRSIEAALAAALDYQLWLREVRSGRRDPLG